MEMRSWENYESNIYVENTANKTFWTEYLLSISHNPEQRQVFVERWRQGFSLCCQNAVLYVVEAILCAENL